MNYVQLVSEIESYTENTFDTNDINTFIQQAEQRIYNSVQLPALRKNVTGNVTTGNKYLACPSDWLSTFSLAVINADNEYLYLLNKDVNFIRQSFPDTDSDFYGEPEYYAQFDQNTFILGPTPDANYSVELHYFYYPESIIQAPLSSLGAIVPGSLYTDGTYLNVPLTGGNGSTATANIIIASGGVISVEVLNTGCLYKPGDTLSAASANIGNTGSGFSIPVVSVGNSTGTSWVGDNFSTVLLYGTLLEAYTYMKGEADVVSQYQKRYDESLELLLQLGDGKNRQDSYRSGQPRIQVRT